MAEEKKKKGKGKKDKARDPKNPYGNYEFDRSKKVSQAVVDKVKDTARKEGIPAAIQKHGGSNAEAVKRLYGQRRYDKYFKSTTGSGSSRGGTTRPSGTVAARAGSAGPMMGGGVGRQVASRKKPTGRAGAVAAAVGAAGIASRAKYQSTKGKSQALRAEEARINKMKPGKARTAALKAYSEAVDKFNSRNQAVQKFAQSKGGKAFGKTARALTGTAARRTGVGLVALTAYEKARQAKAEADKAGRKIRAAGSGRAAAIKKSRGK